MGQLRTEYPRPQYVRDRWLSLNGEWDFAFDDQNEGLQNRWYTTRITQQVIEVPFAYQSELSGINVKDVHPVVWYQKEFSVPRDWDGRRVLLNFGAVDYFCQVWVNGTIAGCHEGGYDSFFLDISPFLNPAQNLITVRVVDYSNTSQPRGKQTARDESWGCWYTPVTGIWQSVWLEAVGKSYIDHVKLETEVQSRKLGITYYLDNVEQGLTLKIRVSKDGEEVLVQSKEVEPNFNRFSNIVAESHGHISYHIPDGKLWTPEEPHLYDLELTLEANGVVLDKVLTYFGIRQVEQQDGRVTLNGKPYYLRMVLDQGFWPQGIYTPSSIEEIRSDVEMTKAFGFNGARKHQKFEDPYYYYYCDKLGLLTWCEMPSCYYYDEDVSRTMTEQWQRLVIQHYNFPSVIAWVPLNESWGVDQLTDGQPDMRAIHHMITLYHLTKSLDTTRLVIGNDGWQMATTDVIAIHDYSQDASELQRRYGRFKEDRHSRAFLHGHQTLLDGFPYMGQPIMVTEFGGVKVDEQGAQGWGYGEAAADYTQMLERISSLVEFILGEPELCGYCYTQLTDVEQEVNGLMTYERQPKVTPQKYAAIFQRNPTNS